MTKLPARTETENKLQQDFERELCQRDYRLLEAHYPGIYAHVCKMVAANVELEAIRKWAERIVRNEPLIVQRICNSARYEQKLQVEK